MWWGQAMMFIIGVSFLIFWLALKRFKPQFLIQVLHHRLRHLCNLQLRNLHNASRGGYRGKQASRRRSLQLDLPQPPRGVHRDLTLLPPFPTRTIMFCGPRPDLFLSHSHSLSHPPVPLQDDAHRNWQAVVLGKCLVLPIVGTIGFGVGFATKVRCLC